MLASPVSPLDLASPPTFTGAPSAVPAASGADTQSVVLQPRHYTAANIREYDDSLVLAVCYAALSRWETPEVQAADGRVAEFVATTVRRGASG